MTGGGGGFVRLETDQTPLRAVRLTFCTVSLYDGWAWTAFPDGSGYGAFPHDTDEYREVARRMGYGADTMAYCWEHEVCHAFIEQEVSGRPSPILWALAHGRRHPDSTVYEEALTQAFQAFLRANTPMSATAPDIDWPALRSKALWLLDTAADPLRDAEAVALCR